MNGIIANFRGSRHRKRGNFLLISIPTITSKEKAQSFIGKHVTWTAPGKEQKKLTGIITAAHGNSGTVRARFDTGMPGQALGKEILIE